MNEAKQYIVQTCNLHETISGDWNETYRAVVTASDYRALQATVVELQHENVRLIDSHKALQAKLAAVEDWDVRKFVVDIPEGEGLSHEDGWTIMKTDTATSMQQRITALEEALKKAMELAGQSWTWEFKAKVRRALGTIPGKQDANQANE